VTLSQAARALGISRHTLSNACKRGALRTVRRVGAAPGGHVLFVDIEDVRALYPTTSPNGGPAPELPDEKSRSNRVDVDPVQRISQSAAAPAGVEAAVQALVAAAVAQEAAPLRGELEAALAVVRRVGARLSSIDAERRELERQQAALEAEQARLADAIEKHRTARAAYEDRRREMSRLMVEATRKPPKGTAAAR
jgi:hypothetical protein